MGSDDTGNGIIRNVPNSISNAKQFDFYLLCLFCMQSLREIHCNKNVDSP